MSATDLPDSGDPGVRPPEPGQLPRPPLWTPGQEQAPFRGVTEEGASAPAGRRREAFVAVAIMVAGLVVIGLAVALMNWAVGLCGAVVGAAGAVLALRSHIMEDVSVSDQPGGPS